MKRWRKTSEEPPLFADRIVLCSDGKDYFWVGEWGDDGLWRNPFDDEARIEQPPKYWIAIPPLPIDE